MANNKQVPPVEKRRPPAAGMGRKKGSQNKVTKQLKEMILGALDQAGGQAYLLEQAHNEPKAFMALLGRILPMQVSGDPDAPLVTRIERVILK